MAASHRGSEPSLDEGIRRPGGSGRPSNSSGSGSRTGGGPYRRWCFTIFDDSGRVTTSSSSSSVSSGGGRGGHVPVGPGDMSDVDDDGDGSPLVNPRRNGVSVGGAQVHSVGGVSSGTLSGEDVRNSVNEFVCTFWTLPEPPSELIRGLVYQYERCPSSGRVHVQGYVELNRPCRLAQVKGILGSPSAHLEVANGDGPSNVAYCTKEESRVEGTEPVFFGKLDVKQGTRTDVQVAVDTLKSGGTLSELIDKCPDVLMKYPRGVQLIQGEIARVASNNLRQLKVTVIWGAAGVGKTRRVYEEHGFEDVYSLSCPSGSALWWDGYVGQSVLLIDDFYGWIPYGLLLRVLDIYPLQLQIKGASTYARWTQVYITSNKAPENWYAKGMTAALQRRLHDIVHMEGAGDGEDGGEGQYAPGFVPPV